MVKGLYQVTSGDSYFVRAECEELAELIYHVNVGNLDLDYAREQAQGMGFEINTEDIDSIEFIEASTIVEPIMDFANTNSLVHNS